MPIRLTGLMSGMDTESLIQQLVEAKRTKVDSAKKAQTKLSWKQEAWSDLNKKLKNLQSKYISNMKYYASYSKRTTKVSNESAVSVITGENAVNGVQSLQVKQLAKTAYLTGSEIEGTNGEVTALSKMSDLGFGGSGVINLTTDGKSVDINVTEDTTISDFLTQVKNAGLNANFDAGNQRFFISAKKSGEDSDFSFTASDAGGAAALKALGLQVSLDKDAATKAEYTEYAAFYNNAGGDKTATLGLINADGRIDKAISSRVDSYLNQYKSLVSDRDAAQKKIDEINEKYKDSTLDTADNYAKRIEELNAQIEEKKTALDGADEADKEAIQAELDALNEELTAVTEKKSDADVLAAQTEVRDSSNSKIAEVKTYVDITETTDGDGNVTYSADATAKLTGEVEDSYYNKAAYASQVMANPGAITGTGATKIGGQDAIIYLNGAEFTGSDNVFEINGLTFTALSETKDAGTENGETVTVTTQDDVDGIYDMVKNFLKEYNSIINEMDKLYNADSAKGYEPLTDEEKDAMSEKEIEKYEDKIKDALLKGDTNLSNISLTLKTVMSSGIEVNGKTMYLHNFGIETQSYFEADENERNAYHIAGDPDDETSSGEADVLKSMISNDPDTVISFFTELSRKLDKSMSDMTKSVKDYRSYGSFYDDKKMKSDYDSYTTKIKQLEAKLNDYEDKWYKKFAAMESALAKMQSNTNALTGLLGG